MSFQPGLNAPIGTVHHGTPPRLQGLVPWLIAIAVGWAVYRYDRVYGGFLGDEGYLWYGVRRLLAGEVPVRDFMSYELGRYYLAALPMWATAQDGILALRAVLGAVAALGVGLALHALWRAHPPALATLVLQGIIFAAWMAPRHKVWDDTVSIGLVLIVQAFLDRPVPRRGFVLGVVVGGAAVIGQNHGIYGLTASALAWLLCWRMGQRPDTATAMAWAGGIVAGYAPVWLAWCLVPGYAAAAWDAIHYLLVEYKGVNLPLPLPWPWKAQVIGGGLQAWTFSAWFVALQLALAWGVVTLARRGREWMAAHTLACAALIVALPYANVVFSRADTAHLAQAIAPLLMLVFALSAASRSTRRVSGVVACVVALGSLPLVLPLHPGWIGRHVAVAKVQVGMDWVKLPGFDRQMLSAGLQAPGPGGVLALPYYPGLSAALDERSPTWEIYPIFPRSQEFEQRELSRLEATPPRLVLVASAPIDGRPDLAYERTHPLIDAWIKARYISVQSPAPAGIQALAPADGRPSMP